MANQVVGTGSVEIIFDYEKNLKKSINDIKKAWSNSDIGDVFKQIDSSMVNINTKTKKISQEIIKIKKNEEEEIVKLHARALEENSKKDKT